MICRKTTCKKTARAAVALYLFLIFVFPAAAAQWSHEESDLAPDPRIVWGRLEKGFRYVLMQNTEPEDRVGLHLNVQAGSLHEREDERGIAHFLEHLMFKGTKRRPNTLAITKELDSVGASFNAFTGKDHTGYYIKIDATKVNNAIDLLKDMLFHSKFDPVEMKREKSVIIEEINMYEDNPMMYAEDLLEQVMFDGNTLGWEIAGSRQSVLKMKRRKVLAFRDRCYVPERMVIAVAGKVD